MPRLSVISCLFFGILSTLVEAGFQNSFRNVTQRSDLLLQWEPTDENDYSIAIHARLLNRTSKYEANSIEMDIATGINSTSFLWQSVPYPLPYLRTATYEIEIRPMGQLGEEQITILTSSPYFMIAPEDQNRDQSMPSNESFIIPPIPTDEPSSGNGRINNNAAIAAGLVIPVVVALAVIGFLWVQRRQRRSLEESRKRREALVIE
ncbi:hypothetical protein F4810DRAFT_421261 [Camillea tinctor]|nr:hypothetical protein F4810DRAFT_421261 [Camillea tinctor]